ncbi:cation transporter [Silvibacterium dinghuense]|nr:cation transporter [Silvibacterium dinghuense]
MLIECFVALIAAWDARSASLLAFGSDSLVELISALVVLLQFASPPRMSQAKAARFCGLLLYVLAAVVTAIAIFGLIRRQEVELSPLGIAITAGALVLMPVLAYFKRREAERTGSKALRADAVQSAACAYLAALTLAGLLLRSWFGFDWLDSVAALAAVPILVLEAKRARRGQVCSCC